MNAKQCFNIREAKGDDYYRIMVVNEALKNFDKKELFPWLLTISIDIGEKTEQFDLPTEKESEILNFMEDTFNSMIGSATTYQYVGRTTGDGIRDLYYYIESPQKIDESLTDFIDRNEYLREFDYSIVKDVNWDGVQFFFDY